MKTTDTSEKALEQLIVRHLAGISEHPRVGATTAGEPQAMYAPGGYVLGRASDYNLVDDNYLGRLTTTILAG